MVKSDKKRVTVTLSDDEYQRIMRESKTLSVTVSEYMRALLLRGRDGLNFALFQKQIQEINAKMDLLKDIKPAGTPPMQTPQPAQQAENDPAIAAAIMEILAFTRYRFLSVLSYDAMQKAGVTIDKTAVQERAAKTVLVAIRNSVTVTANRDLSQ